MEKKKKEKCQNVWQTVCGTIIEFVFPFFLLDAFCNVLEQAYITFIIRKKGRHCPGAGTVIGHTVQMS